MSLAEHTITFVKVQGQVNAIVSLDFSLNILLVFCLYVPYLLD